MFGIADPNLGAADPIQDHSPELALTLLDSGAELTLRLVKALLIVSSRLTLQWHGKLRSVMPANPA
jgi:hypothetical protein